MTLKTLSICAAALLMLPGCDGPLGGLLGQSEPAFTVPDPLPERIARPAFVVVDGDRIIAEMSDGVQCLGNAGGSFTAAGWTGTFSDCPYPYTYAVALAAGTPARQIPLAEVTTLTVPLEDGEVPFRPIASVRITDTAGQSYRFESAEGF